MNENKLFSLLGIAQKAGKLTSGEIGVEKGIRSGSAKLIIVAQDASENTKKNYRDMALYYNIPYYESLSKEQLGRCIGKWQRAALIITDVGLGDAIIKQLR